MSAPILYLGLDVHKDSITVAVFGSTGAEERVRDLVRCRETFQKEILASRHYVLKFLRRRGFVFREGCNWSRAHFDWLRRLRNEPALAEEDEVVLSEYLALLEYKLQRRDELDRRIEEIALTPLYKPIVERLRCFRGLDTHAAMVLTTEIGDWRRFESPRPLMAYLEVAGGGWWHDRRAPVIRYAVGGEILRNPRA